MNMNGRRLFKMLEDFAYNVAENFGIASDQNAVDGDYETEPTIISAGVAPALVSQIGSHTPLFGRLDTLYKPARPSSISPTTTTSTTTTSPTTTTTMAPTVRKTWKLSKME